MDSSTAGPSNQEDEPLWSSQPTDQDDRSDITRDELYTILNLPREASEEDIQRSYKKLAALLHPDRHPDPKLKSAADSRFQALQRAYDILSDRRKRTVYDALGEEGLRTSWELTTKQQTPDELRVEFERLARKQLEADVEQLVKSRGELTCTTDARVLFLPDEERRNLGGPPHMSLLDKAGTVKTARMFLKHSFITPINSTTSIVTTSQLLAQQGVGGGNLNLKLLSRPSPKLSLEIGTTTLRPRFLTFKCTYAPDPDSFLIVEGPVKTVLTPPPLSITLGRQIYEQITGTFTLRTGVYSLGSWGRSSLEPTSSSTVTLGLIDRRGWSLQASTGLVASNLSADWGKTVLGGVKFRVGATVTSQGALSTFVSGERKMTENTRAAMALDCALNGAMTVKLTFMRLGQKVVLPVLISSSFNPTLAVTFTVIPTLSMIAANHFIVAPRKRRRMTSRIAELRKEHAEFIEQKRKEAEDAVSLLVEHVNRKADTERSNNGLVIESALYGVLESMSTPSETLDVRWLDVTVAVQALVSDSQLVIPGGRSKASLLGFYDCAMGEKKRLRVRYTFKGRTHLTEVDDFAAVAAPLRGHLVD